MIRLAGIAITVVLAAGCLGGGKADEAAQYRHYYNVGKRACRPGGAVKHTAHGVSQVVFSVLDPREYPAKYRKAVSAGCRAAK